MTMRPFPPFGTDPGPWRKLDKTRWAAHDREHRLEAAAAEKAEQVLAVRLESMNHIREQLESQADTFITRELSEAQHSEVCRRLDGLNERLGAAERWQAGIAGRTIGMSAAIGLAAVIISILVRFIE